MTIGKNIKQYRKEANLTQEQLAQKLGIAQNNIYRWETDRIIPTIETLKKLSKVLKISIDNLLFTEKEKQKLNIGNKDLLKKLEHIEKLSPEHRATIADLIDKLLK